MTNVSRKHHFISQFYLKGFADDTEAENSQITVIDKVELKKFSTVAKGIAAIRDFNRVSIEGRRPDFVETELSRLEGEVALAIASIDKSNSLEGKNRALLFEFIAMLAIRNPFMRNNVASFHADITKNALLMLIRNDRELEAKTISMLYPETKDALAYEDITKFIREGIGVAIANEYHLFVECPMIVNLCQILNARQWSLLRATPDTGPFITSDRPVVLCWDNPELVQKVYQNSPGFGLPNTVVYFSLSKNLALVSDFNGEDSVVYGNKKLVACVNTMQIKYSERQLYMPNTDFNFLDDNMELQEGSKLLEQ